MTAPPTKSKLVVFVPLVLVNMTAIFGQAGWAMDHLVPAEMRSNRPYVALVCATMFALTVESVGIYLAYEAHSALMAGQAAARIRMGSYSVAAVVGALNYAHFTQSGWRPNPLAVTFGLLSSISPWLWALRSRSMYKQVLMERGLLDQASVRFSLPQWVLYPGKTYTAFRLAVWESITSPAQARSNYLQDRALRAQRKRKTVRWWKRDVVIEDAQIITNDDEPPSIEASINSLSAELNAKFLLESEPPEWAALSKKEAALRAIELLPNLSSAKISEALSGLGLDISAAHVRQAASSKGIKLGQSSIKA